jgi:hypothetical protein
MRRFGRWSATPLDSTYVPFDAPAQTPNEETRLTIAQGSWVHTFGQRSMVEVRAGYLRLRSDLSVAGKSPGDYEGVFPEFWEGNFEEGNFFATHGDFPLYSERESQVLNLRADVSHAWDGHALKGGTQLAFNRLSLLQLDFPNEVNADGDLGRFRSELEVRNPEGGFYLQDRWRYQGLVLNAGLRYDFFSLGNQFDPEEADVKVRTQWSPRLGIAFPLTDRDAISFHYGRFFQIPDRRFVFEERDSSVRVRGNLNLEPQVTVAYQATVQHVLTQDAALGFSVFFKDIFGLLTTERRQVEGFVDLVDVWTNQDFATARGFEISLRKRTAAPFWGELAYTLSSASGVASEAEANLESQQQRAVPVERPLDWDQRHTLSATAHIGVPADWLVTAVATYGSGLPYTPIQLGERNEFRPERINSARLPSTFRVDATLIKQLHFWDQHFALSLRAFNLFDTRDIADLTPDISPHPFVDESDYLIYYTETGQAGGAAIQVDASGGQRFAPLDDPRVWQRGRVIRVSIGWGL